jgi:photosystem II stability/assembly factor-like uncharacterized protein
LIDERQLFERFHTALDVEPRPGAFDRLQTALVQSEAPRRPQGWFTVTLPQMSIRLLAGVLVVLLAVAAAGISLAAYQYAHKAQPVHTHPGPVSRMCAQGNLDMVTSSVGWQGTRRTTDGGVTWRDTAPPAPPNLVNSGLNTCVLDASHAWVSEAIGPSGKGAQADHLVFFATSDGGQTWQKGEPIPVSGDIAAEFDFIDDQHGWLFTDTSAIRSFYSTSDGGIHWVRVTIGSQTDPSGLGPLAVGCVANGITFVSLDKGWLTWNCNVQSSAPAPGPFVAATTDGGHSWAPVSLAPLPAIGPCSATPPIFAGRYGALQVTCGPWTRIFRTNDAGATWTAGSLPALEGTPGGPNQALAVDFVDGNTGFFFTVDVSPNQTAGVDLYRTTNGGRDWFLVKRGLFPGQDVSSYQFRDSTNGLVYSSGAPWKTTDGGRTWTVAPPYRSIGSVACPLASDPGAGAVPLAMKMFTASTGWAAGARRTTNGGAYWSNVSPRSVPNRSSGYGEFFLDGDHAWVAEAAGSPTACADRVVVSITADGGRTWQQGASIKVQLPGSDFALHGTWSVLIEFVDQQNGWLMVETPSPGLSRGQIPQSLYKTSDGGRHWAMVSDQAGANSDGCTAVGPISFSSPTTGWMGVRCSNGAPNPWPWRFLVTHDAGATWTVQTVAPSVCCTSPLPTFFDENHGWLFVSADPVMLATSDGGSTWSRQPLPPLSYYTCTFRGAFLSDLAPSGTYLHGPPAAPPPGPQICTDDGMPAVSFINPSQGWAILTKSSPTSTETTFRLLRTVDGGKTWTAVGSNLPSASSFPSQFSLTFVDANDGFWLMDSQLFRTTDGGHTWTSVQMTSS